MIDRPMTPTVQAVAKDTLTPVMPDLTLIGGRGPAVRQVLSHSYEATSEQGTILKRY